MNATISTPVRDLSEREVALKARLEQVIRENLEGFKKVGAALTTIRDQQLYREDYDTFDEYIRLEWDMSRPRAYQLIDAVSVMENLSTIVDTDQGNPFEILPVNEAQVRPLAVLDAEKQRIVWGMVIEYSRSEGTRITAVVVQQCVNAYLNERIHRAIARGRAAHKTCKINEQIQLHYSSFLEAIKLEAAANWQHTDRKGLANLLRELLETIED